MKGKLSVGTIWLICFFAQLVTSCTPYTQFTIQVLEPAPITLPPQIRSVAFINRSNKLSEDELRRNEKEVSRYELFVLDSAINNKFFEGLQHGIRESARIDEIYTEIISERKSDSAVRTNLLDSLRLDEHRRKVHADALISLEYYSAKDSIRIYFDDYEGIWQVYLEITSRTFWVVYDLQTNKYLDTFVQNDTMSWYDDQYVLEDAITAMPRLLEAFREAAFTTGYKYSHRIVPSWYDTDRYVYRSGSKEMKQAANLVSSGNWNGAAAIWKELAGSGNTRTMAKAAFNLAVRCEGEDNLKEAIKWAEKSFEIYPDKSAMEYINLLLLRELKRNKLLKQIQPTQADE